MLFVDFDSGGAWTAATVAPPSNRNAAVLFRNLADAATITASSQIADAPISNVKTEHIVTKWRSTTAIAWMMLDFGSAISLDTLAAVGLTADYVRIRASNNGGDASEGEVYDSGWMAVDPLFWQAIAVAGSMLSARYVLIDLESADGAYVECGRVVAGVRSTFHYNMAYGFEVAYPDPSGITETAGLQDIIDPLPVYRTMAPTFEWVSEADAKGFLRTVAMENGTKKDVLFLSDPGGNDLAHDTLWGRLTASMALVHALPDIRSTRLSIKERR